MPALLAPGLCSLVVSASLSLSYQANLRTEARAEQIRPPVGENTTTEALEVQPSVGVAGSSPALRLELTYAPRFTHVGGDGPDNDTWLQLAWAAVRWRPSAAWRLQVNGSAAAGTVDLFRVATAPGQGGEPPPVGQAAPVASALDYRSLQLAFSAEGRLGREFELLGGLAVMREGGTTAAEREILPLQQAAAVRGALTWHLSRRATLAGALTGSMSRYFDVAVSSGVPGDPEHQSWSNWAGLAEAIWRYRLTSRAEAWAGAGLMHVDSGAPGTLGASLQPMGEVGVSNQSGPGWPRLSGAVVLVAAPLEDRLTGTVNQRAELRAWGSLAPAERWSMAASARGGRVLNGTSEGESFTAGDLWLAWAFRNILTLTVGGRWTTQWPAPLAGRSALPTSRWVVYFSIQAGYSSEPREAQTIGSASPLARPLL
jgi:hypothetical protein